MNDGRIRTESVGFKAFISVIQVFNLCLFVWMLTHRVHEASLWVIAAGFALVIAAPWFPRSGKAIWALAGAGTALMICGAVLFFLHR